LPAEDFTHNFPLPVYYTAFQAAEEKIVVYKRMKELEETLPASFIRIHHSYFINTQHISWVEDNQVFAASHQIPISEKYRESFLRKIKAGLL
jgi:DNA-binding LytR/AlgR family response regulator